MVVNVAELVKTSNKNISNLIGGRNAFSSFA